MTRVCACVLTYDRPHLLAECLDGLARQTRPPAAVVVLDNASAGPTREVLRAREGLRVVRLEINAGSSGGFAAAIEAARELDVDWLWLMDDDAEPEPDALERLLAARAASDPGTAALCTAVLGPDGGVDPLHRGVVGRFMRALPASAYANGSEPAVGFASFPGLLVRAAVARAADPPRADLLMWGADVEYSLRLRRHGAIRLVPESRVVHKALMGGVPTARSRFWNRVLGVSYPTSPWREAWKGESLVRNFTWVRYRHAGAGPRAWAGIAAAYAVKALLYDERPLRRIPLIVRAARAGRRAALAERRAAG